MSTAVTRTKLRIPRRRIDLLRRTHLDSLLIDILNHRFTLISAPAGYGKTCLMIDLAHQAPYPVCWYTIDPLDKDPKRFLAHLINSIKLKFPEFGKNALDLLDSMPDPLETPEQFASTFIHDIYTAISENFVIFLDDFHLLDNQLHINNFIGCLGKAMDENTHLVIASRNQFSFSGLPLLIGRKQVLGVDHSDLAFNSDELQAYFNEKLNILISAEDSRKIIESTSGWITGILLKPANKLSPLPGQNKATRVTGSDINSYFNTQVFLKQTSEVRKMMLFTSLLEEFNAAYCQNFFGELEHLSWTDFQNTLTDNNLFVEEIEDNGIWIRYHQLFQSFLKKELERQYPKEKDQILGQLVKTHLEAKNWEYAFDAANRLENAHMMGEVIVSSFGPLFHAGRIRLLSSWLTVLPESGYEAYPILYSLKGFTSNEIGNPSLGIKELNFALENKKIKTEPKLNAKTLIWRATSHRFLGNYIKGIKDSSLALKIISKQHNLYDIEAEALRETGLGYGRLGDNTKSLRFLEKSKERYVISRKENNVAQVKADIGFVCINMGKFGKAEKQFKESIPHWINQGNNIQLSNLMNNLGYLSILLGRFCDANSWLKKGEEYALLASSKRMQAFLTASRADLARSLNLYEISIDYYNQALKLNHDIQDSFLNVYIPLSKAISFRYLNELSMAERILKELKRHVLGNTSSYELGLWHLECGFVALSQKSLNLASKAFKSALSVFSGINRPYEKAKSLLGLVLFYSNKSSNRLRNKHLKALDKASSSLESLQPLLPEINQHLPILRDLASFCPHNKLLRNCLEEIELQKQSLSVHQTTLFPHTDPIPNIPLLEIQGFGEIDVRIDGVKVTASEWIHQKTVREILFYLLSNPHGATKEEIGLVFWPDSSPSQLNCQFKNVVYRLRRALGANNIQYQQNTRSYSFNWAGNYTYDVEEFQKYYRIALDQIEEINKIKYLRHSVTYYKHPFGPQLEGSWVESIRRKLYLLYEELILEIAAYDLKRHKYLDSRNACFTILEIEPCQEKAYELGMRALHGLNDPIGIQRLYQRCLNNFKNILGIPPYKTTSNLYHNLINSF